MLNHTMTTADTLVDHYGEPHWAVEEIENLIERAKTPIAKQRLQALISEIWAEYEGGPGPSEEEIAADCDARAMAWEYMDDQE